MRSNSRLEVTLNLRAGEPFLPLATAFAEKAAAAFGMAETDALSLTLATEEIFAYLCRVAAPGRAVQIRCRHEGYYVEEEFLFNAEDFDMKAFNLTASASFDDDSVREETGLLIASRMVDRFRFTRSDDGLRLTLIKEKSYPPASEEIQASEARPLDEFSVRAPEPEEIKLLAHLVSRYYGSFPVPNSFLFPGKLVDMAAVGEVGAVIAVDRAGHIGGGFSWRWSKFKTVECAGPYLFNQRDGSDIARALVDACLGAIARTHAMGLLCLYPSPQLPEEYFEKLGTLTRSRSDGTRFEVNAYYRHLEEDLGSTVWTHPLLEAFLSSEYQRLVFAREVRQVRGEGETHSPFAVLSADFDRTIDAVTLRPVWWGIDAEKTLASYVQILLKEQISCILFQMDLGRAWHCHFTPALLSNGFVPRLVLPNAGQRDLVVFQHKTVERWS